MRVLIIKQASDLQALGAKLLGKSAATSATLERVKALNPHLDFSRPLEPGVVVFLPDTPALKDNADDTSDITGDAFQDFTRDAAKGFKSAGQRLRAAESSLASERAAVEAVLKSAGVKRLISSDPVLKKQVAEAGSEFDARAKRLEAASEQFRMLQSSASEELAVLAKWMG